MNSKVEMGLRLLFALSLIVFGLNKFFHFIPTPPIEGTGGDLIKIYAESGFMKLIGGLELLGGISLLVNKFVPLSLTISSCYYVQCCSFSCLPCSSRFGERSRCFNPKFSACILS